MNFQCQLKEKIRALSNQKKIAPSEIVALVSFKDFFQFAYEVDHRQYRSFKEFFNLKVKKNNSLAEREKEFLVNDLYAMEIMEFFFYQPSGNCLVFT